VQFSANIPENYCLFRTALCNQCRSASITASNAWY